MTLFVRSHYHSFVHRLARSRISLASMDSWFGESSSSADMSSTDLELRHAKAQQFQTFIRTRLVVDQEALKSQLQLVSSELQSW